jgi:F0F1-type ATP synthase assembly protein I
MSRLDSHKLPGVNQVTEEDTPLQGPEQKPTSGMSLLAEVSTLAWNLVIPIVGGIMLGHYLDNRYGSGLTWSLSLLVLGVIIAFSNLYNLYIEHGQQKIQRNTDQKEDGKAHAQEK